MGAFRKEKNYESTVFTKSGRSGPMRMMKRLMMKLFAFFIATVVFGILYSQTTQALLDAAWNGHITWRSAVEQSLIKALQYGVMNWPALFTDGVFMIQQGRVFTALINYFIPLFFLFMANFYIVSFVLDMLDGREGEVFRYWVVLIATILFMGFVWAFMNGAFMLTGADVTFNTTEIVCNLNVTGDADPLNGVNTSALQEATNTSLSDLTNSSETFENVVNGTVFETTAFDTVQQEQRLQQCHQRIL